MDIPKKKICVIVITYNPLQWIEKCLQSIWNSTLNVKIILIDNYSKDGFQYNLKEKLQGNDVKLIQLKKNIGFGQANNIGFTYALQNNYDYVFLLNQDAFVQENTIESLIKVSLAYPEFGILSPMHLNGDGKRLDLNFSNYISEVNCEGLISDILLNRNKMEIYELPFVNAAAWLIPITTLKKIGGFDPIFFHYGEDDNYCQRAIYHGIKIGVVPNAVIFHDRPQSLISKSKYEDIDIFEKIVKIYCGNINYPFLKPFNWEKKELKKKIFISFFNLNYKGAIKWTKFYFRLISITSLITKSREQNTILGPNYLNE